MNIGSSAGRRLDTKGRPAVTTHDHTDSDVSDGIMFAAGAEIALASGQAGSIHISNPVGSGVNVLVSLFDAYQDTATSLKIVFFRDASSTGTVATPVNLLFGGSTTTKGVVKTGQGVLSGGIELNISTRTVRDEHYRFEGLIIIPPGSSGAFRMSAPGGLSGGAVLNANVIWKEEPVTA